jgi:hypothetical protein
VQIVGDGFLFFLETFDTFDKCAKLVAGDAMSIRHRGLLIVKLMDCWSTAEKPPEGQAQSVTGPINGLAFNRGPAC